MNELEEIAILQRLDFIIIKCEQYWNETGICDAEVHAILENIHRHAREVRDHVAAKRPEDDI